MVRPARRARLAGPTTLGWLAMTGIFLVRERGAELAVSAALCLVTAAGVFALTWRYDTRRRLELIAGVVTYVGIGKARVVAARGQSGGKVVRLLLHAQPPLQCQLWLRPDGTCAANLGERQWGAETLERIRRDVGLPLEEREGEYTGQQLVELYPGSFSTFVAAPGLTAFWITCAVVIFVFGALKLLGSI